MDIIIGLLIGNILAVLSWTLITTPIAVDTRLSLYTYLNKIAGSKMSKLYDWANVLIFTVISAAMVTVSATAVRFAFNIPAQLNWYPTNVWFMLIVVMVGIVVVLVAIYGFNAVSDFSGICAPWLFTMFTSGALVLLPALSLSVVGKVIPASWAEFISIGNQSIWTGINSNGEPGIGLVEVIGFGLNALDVMSFYYLFIPTWIFTIILYTILAGRYGAKKAYPEAEAKEKRYHEMVEQYQQKLAAKAPQRIKDTSTFSKFLKTIAFVALGITLVLAGNVLFGSNDENAYIANRDTFYFYGFICTVVYFVTAYWAMQRSKKLA